MTTTSMVLPTSEFDSKIAKLYTECEAHWRRFTSRHYPGAACVRWSPWHRVYRHGGRAVKVQWLAALPDDPLQHVKNEFALLERMARVSHSLHPSYREIDGAWAVLEMDWIDGVHLDDLLRERRGREVSVRRLLGELLHLGRVGVVHRQLRPRHIYRRRDGVLFLIDFGGSYRTSALRALWRNFAPFEWSGGRWRPRSIAIMLARLLFGYGETSDTLDERIAAANKRAWQANRHRPLEILAAILRDTPGDAAAAKHFLAMEKSLEQAIQDDPRHHAEIWSLQFAAYVLYGNRNLGLVWERASSRIVFAGKTVVAYGCGMGALATLAMLSGAGRVTAFDESPALLDAARHFSQGLGVDAIDFRFLDRSDHVGDGVALASLPDADIFIAVSHRFDAPLAGPVLDQLARYPELLLETRDAARLSKELARRGYEFIAPLVNSYADRWIIHAARRRAD